MLLNLYCNEILKRPNNNQCKLKNYVVLHVHLIKLQHHYLRVN